MTKSDNIKEKVKRSRTPGIKGIAKKAIKELERIAFSEEEPIKIRMDILKWFAELEVGKPKAGNNEAAAKEERSFDIKVYVED